VRDEPLPLGFPRLKGTEGKVWTCRRDEPGCTRTKPCRACLGARNQRKGKVKQRAGRKVLEAVSETPASRFVGALGNEETWRLPVRVECKAGAQVKTMFTKYLAAEAQAEASRASGDARPFVMVAMPPGTTDGLVVVRLSELARVIEALIDGG
jgi:hypothetical protein